MCASKSRFLVPLVLAAGLLVLTLLALGNITPVVAAPPRAPLPRPLAIDVGGVIVSDTTWTTDDSPYVLTADVIVAPGVTLTIEPGVVVQGQLFRQLQVQGRLVALGTVAQPITFTSENDDGPNQWAGLVFDGGTGYLKHTVVRYAGLDSIASINANVVVSGVLDGEVRIENSYVLSESYAGAADCGLYIRDSRVVISGTQFSGNGSNISDHALYATGDRTVLTFTHNTVSGNGGYAAHLEPGHLHHVWMADNDFYANGENRVRIVGGSMTGTATLLSQNGLEGYELDDAPEQEFVVPTGATLAVEPGVALLGQVYAELLVQGGHLQALGTLTRPITFTRKDSSNWKGLTFDGGTGELRHTTVRYGGSWLNSVGVRSSIAVSGVLAGQVRMVDASSVVSSVNQYGLYVRDSHVVVSDTTFRGNGNNSSAFALYTSGPNTVITLTNNHFYTNKGYAMGVGTEHLHQVQMAGNDLEGNDKDRVLVEGESLATDATLAPQARLEGYELDQNLEIMAGVTLNVEPGVVVMGADKIGGTELRIVGHLRALGTQAQPITFTSGQDSGPNEWKGLAFAGGTGELDYVTVRYGGASDSLGVHSNVAISGVLDGQVSIENSQLMSGAHPVSSDSGLHVENSRVAISGTTFMGNGSAGSGDYALYTTGPNTVITLTNNRFYTNSGTTAAVRVGTDHLHQVRMTGNDFGGNSKDRVHIEGGTLEMNATLFPQSGLAGYVSKQDLTIAAGVTLTVEPGVVMMGDTSDELRVQGHLQALGTDARPITFTSALNSSPSEWSGLVFDGGTGRLNHVLVRYGGDPNSVAGVFSNVAISGVLDGQVCIENSQLMSVTSLAQPDYGVYVINGRATVSGTTFMHNGGSANDYALYTAGPHTAITLTHNHFYTNSGYVMRLGTDHLHQVRMTGNVLDGNHKDRVLIQGQLMTVSASLTPQPGLVGYELDSDLTISTAATLNLEPGAVVMVPILRELRVAGRLQALGTPTQPITFTSEYNSDSGQWDGLIFDGGTGDLRHATVRYAGYTGYGLHAIGPGTALTLTNSGFYTNDGYAIGVGADHLPQVRMTGNDFGGNGKDRVLIQGESLVGSATLAPQSGLEGYELEQSMTISTAATLDVEPGVRVMLRRWEGLWVAGHLQARGTAAQPIIFTSASDSSVIKWSGLIFDGGTGDLRHVTVRYGGAPGDLLPIEQGSNIAIRNVLTGSVYLASSHVLSAEHPSADGLDYGLYVQDSHVVISGTTFRDNGNRSSDYALYITGTHTAITVAQSTVEANSGYGLRMDSGQATVGCCSVTGNGSDGIWVDGGSISGMGNSISGHSDFGLNNTSGVTVVAQYNWWGSATGPTHPSNPGGTGDRVSDDVDFRNFLSGPSCVLDLEVSQSDWPDPVYVLDPLTYTVVIANNSAMAASGVVLTDDLPSGVMFGSATPSRGSCDGTDEIVTCDIGSLPSQASADYRHTYVTIVVTPTAAAEGVRTNEVSIGSQAFDPWTDNNSAQINTTVEPHADLAISKSAWPNPVQVEQFVTYTLVVTNNGPSIATGIRLTDTLPEGMEVYVIWGGRNCSTAGPITCEIYPLGVGSAETIEIVVVPTLTGSFINTASVSGERYDRQPDNDVSAETVMVTDVTGCLPASEVQLARVPAGALFAGNTVRFTARADGSVPFTYTWALDGAPVGEDKSTFEHTFDASGVFSVSVTVDNACGQDSEAMLVDVQEPVPGQPDLSGSYKMVSRANVGDGDILMYTLVLRNSNAVTASVTLTDPLPAHTTYVAGSAQASYGNLSEPDGGPLYWSGALVSGTPAVIQFAVQVAASGLSMGAPITNVARLDDGLGHEARLEARSVYNPGYWLAINDGALYTNKQAVTLTLAWASADQPTELHISNDGGFGTGTGWISVTTTYPGWTLDASGSLLMPRTVHAKFRDSYGLQYGPVQDDIIYDPNPPWVVDGQVVSLGTLDFLLSLRQTNVLVRITTGDDNSGVNKVQLSHSADMDPFSEYPVTGSTTDVPWDLQASGVVYVRAVDRAGNRSTIVQAGEQQFEIYLPLLLKSH